MANLQKTKEDALAIIDSALAILNKFPKIELANTELSFNTSSNPFDFLLDAFKNTAGYNILINIISNFIIYGIPPLEIAVKALLLSNIKNLLSCSINPFITDKLLNEGIVFNLEQIDISDTLRYCPTTQKGSYYYFDNKNPDGTFMIPDELINSTDFNCLLWYVKERARSRVVWGKKSPSNEGSDEIKSNATDYWNANKGKCRKGAGIVTLQFNERPLSLTTAQGTGQTLQTPFNNCLHVFLGNVAEESAEENVSISKSDKDIIKAKQDLDNLLKEKQEYIDKLEGFIEENNNNSKLLDKNQITEEDYLNRLIATEEIINRAIQYIEKGAAETTVDEKSTDEFSEYIEGLKNDYGEDAVKNTQKVTDVIKSAKENYKYIVDKQNEIVRLEKQRLSIPTSYRSIKENYYYRRTLIEFNTDYVMSLRLFDSKVIAAQLIDSLVGLITIDLDLSYKQQLIKNEIKKMVEMIVETDSSTVDDCFFTFTNDAYNAMLEKSELNRAKLFSVNGEFNGTTQIDVESILSKLNDISDDAQQDGNVTLIEHALNEISEELSSTSAYQRESINVGIKFNFIENLLNNLAYVLASSILSPKVYLLILVNLNILGQETNFSLEEFIGKFKQMIADLIRMLRDQLLKFLVEQLMKILGNIAVEIAVKIGVEQAEYYARLMKKIIECFKSKGSSLDFDIDRVRHADIVSEEITEKNTEC